VRSGPTIEIFDYGTGVTVPGSNLYEYDAPYYPPVDEGPPPCWEKLAPLVAEPRKLHAPTPRPDQAGRFVWSPMYGMKRR